MKRYTHQTLFISLLLCSVIAFANGLANPFLMFDTPVITPLNQWITENYFKQLLFKPYQLRAKMPHSLILGASQAGVAFNPDLLPQPAYNLAVGGSTSYIQHRLLQEALATSPALDTVILEIPFLAFNDDDPNNTPGADAALENRLKTKADGSNNVLQPAYAAQEIVSSLLSWEITRASVRMASKQQSITQKNRGSFIQLRNGQWIQQASPNSHTRQLFENSWKKAIFNDWLPAPLHTYSLPDTHSGAMHYFRESLHQLYTRNIHTTLVIAPMHASLMLGLQEAGLWPTYQQWKKSMVTINREEAARAGKTAFLLFDFATVNAITNEDVPAADSTTPMQWFNDSLHPSPQFGDLVFKEILIGNTSNGRLLDSDNIDSALLQDETRVQQYGTTHPDVKAAILQMFQNPKKT